MIIPECLNASRCGEGHGQPDGAEPPHVALSSLFSPAGVDLAPAVPHSRRSRRRRRRPTRRRRSLGATCRNTSVRRHVPLDTSAVSLRPSSPRSRVRHYRPAQAAGSGLAAAQLTLAAAGRPQERDCAPHNPTRCLPAPPSPRRRRPRGAPRALHLQARPRRPGVH